MRVAVTGAYGYSGQYIAQRLLDAGHEVYTLTNSPHRANRSAARTGNSRVRVHGLHRPGQRYPVHSQPLRRRAAKAFMADLGDDLVVVRQRILIPPFPGSNPGAPAKFFNELRFSTSGLASL